MTSFESKFLEIKEELDKISDFESNKFERIILRFKSLVTLSLGESSEYIKLIDSIKASYSISIFGLSKDHISDAKNIVQIIIDEIELKNAKANVMAENVKLTTTSNSSSNNFIDPTSKKVFIVHGHNSEMKESVARAIEKLGLTSIILHEQPNGDATVIEKLTKNADVGFAIVLLSGDDYGYAVMENSNKAKKRARQNVIFELGYFIARLGRKRVVALFEESNDFEIPSDLHGVIYIPYSKNGRWQLDLIQELAEVGYKVDANKLLK